MNLPITTPHRKCPVCSAGKVTVRHHQKFMLPDQHPLPAEFDIVECAGCGFVYADTHATRGDYDRYYSDYSKYTDGCSSGGGGDFYDGERYAAVAGNIVDFLPARDARIVDIGCSNGGMLQALKSRGYTNLFGVDPSIDCVNHTRATAGIEAGQGWLLQLPPAAAGADLVMISHVFEHVLDLAEAIDSVRKILKPAGCVYVEVPDAKRYADHVAAPFQDFNTEHINHFGTTSLVNLFGGAGFDCLAIHAKTFLTAAGVNYPAIHGFFRTRAAGEAPYVYTRDAEFSAAMENYIHRSRALINEIDRRLAPLEGREVIVWGVGQLTAKLLVETSLSRAKIISFIDSNRVYRGKEIRGIPILGPEELKSLSPAPIVIGSLLHHAVIRKQIEEVLGLPNPVIVLA